MLDQGRSISADVEAQTHSISPVGCIGMIRRSFQLLDVQGKHPPKNKTINHIYIAKIFSI